VLDDKLACDIIKIGGLVRNKVSSSALWEELELMML
jgi:hypothetical protein